MTSIYLLNLTLRKNTSENVIEYGFRRRSTLEKPNAPKVGPQEWCGSLRYL